MKNGEKHQVENNKDLESNYPELTTQDFKGICPSLLCLFLRS